MDVLWSLSTLRFTNSENFQDCQAEAEELLGEESVNELQRDLRGLIE